METPSEILRSQRDFFRSGATLPLAFRLERLRRLRSVLEERRDAFLDALRGDLGKHPVEGLASEFAMVRAEIDHALRRLHRWMRPERVPTPVFNWPGRSWIQREPRGAALIIAPWNYPLLLALQPLAGAIAAGCTAVVKPGELAPATSAAIAGAIGDAFDPAHVRVVEGGAETARGLLEERWDHIFFTGGTAVGRMVMEAASRHLTQVTLELGGKSPALVLPDADLARASRRIAWGKFLNAGQTCIAPDHVLVHRDVETPLLEGLVRAVGEFYGPRPRESSSYGRIVSERHFDRLAGYLDAGGVRIVHGGDRDRSARYLAPTIVAGVDGSSPLLREEIFGPILPVVACPSAEAMVEMTRSRPDPLALYIFTRDRRLERDLLARIPAGGACINDVVVHAACGSLPFGGRGASGMGSYHGRASFECFSHSKGVLRRGLWPDIRLRYPPYRISVKLMAAALRRLF